MNNRDYMSPMPPAWLTGPKAQEYYALDALAERLFVDALRGTPYEVREHLPQAAVRALAETAYEHAGTFITYRNRLRAQREE